MQVHTEETVSVRKWLLILLLTAVPFVNIVAICVMAFGNFNTNIKNYGKATLMMFGVGLLIAMFTAFL
ncbi:hypothetical protein [Salirhabdus salicampi]|uniref:hypothetical protein n=1 Tax=Salirhabdus salicampi TaxID=476102 RepID=UPI0020C292EF|nr:hypothetical protein [Salirhabdus salicampi]MCP8617704.1 hypothetical protein [Salirhabdus salicampi]